MNRKFRRAKGAAMIQIIAFTLASFMLSALAIDFGYYFTAQNVLQSAADAGALAGAKELYTNPSPEPSTRWGDAKEQATGLVNSYTLEEKTLNIEPDADVQFGYIDPATGIYDAATFETPSADPNYAGTGGFNAVRVIVRKNSGNVNGPLTAMMGKLVGIETMDTEATSVAMMDATISTVIKGLRPFYACQAQFDFINDAINSGSGGTFEDYTVRVYGESLTVNGQPIAGCPDPLDGNWGFADFRNNSPDAPGAPLIEEWILNGYDEGPIGLGETIEYSTQSGNEISNANIIDALDSIIGQSIMVPLLTFSEGSGSNTVMTVTGYAGFVITGFEAHGPPDGRYIEGHFTHLVCANSCNNGGNPSGTSVVKLRLAR